jgi:putative hemolysin
VRCFANGADAYTPSPDAYRFRLPEQAAFDIPKLRTCNPIHEPLAGACAGQSGNNGGSVVPLHFGDFEVRLAASPAEIEAAQRLRYQVFFEEMAALPSPEVRAARRDCDDFDAICDHLLVIDRGAEGGNNGGPVAVAGTYRLLRRTVALQHHGFYSQQEYDVSRLLDYPSEIVELGRSCVGAAYRTRGVMQMLWRGLSAYAATFDIRLMFGCASFPGTDPEEVGAELAYLYHYHLAPQHIRPRALPQRYVDMGLRPAAGLDVAAVQAELPPLIKGYLRVGGYVGDGAVVDREFNTTDVCVIVNTEQLTGKYERRYKRPTQA